MIANIVDQRRRPYRWREITAIVEATWHDNSVQDSDQSDSVQNADAVDYDAAERISLADAISWAHSLAGEVTLYLYDLGDGISIKSPEDTER